MTAGSNHFERLADAVGMFDAPRALGRVSASSGGSAQIEGLALPVGGWALVRRAGGAAVEGEAASADLGSSRLELLESGVGIAPGDVAEFGGAVPVVRLSRALLGRAIDSLGRPVDGRGPVAGSIPVALPSGAAAGFPRAGCMLAGGETAEQRSSFLACAAREHGGPVIALLAGGTAASHERFCDLIGPAAARTACVLEPGAPPPVRAKRAARVAVALAGFLREEDGGAQRDALLVVDWRMDLPAPVELAGEVESIWSLSLPSESFDVRVGLATKEAKA